MKSIPSSRRWAAAISSLLLLAVASGPAWGAADPAAIQDKLNKTAAAYGQIETELATTVDRIAQLEVDLKRADEIVARYTVTLQARAGWLYKSGGAAGTYLEGLLASEDFGVAIKRIQFLAQMGETDSKIVEGLMMTKARAALIREQLEAQKARQKTLLNSLANTRRQLALQFRGAQAAARITRFGDFDSFTLPIAGPSAFANTWGAPRSGSRTHKGTDVMAPCGAPVVAVTNGVISDLGSGGAGGIMMWLRATNGDVFFYAHLRSYSSGTSVGRRVTTGDLVAYNGNSGNARGGACHVHFEWHPGGGSPVNPYPLLRAVLG